jgi:YD repeat-containing protein
VSFSYAVDGQRSAMTDGSGSSSYHYDSLDRLIQSTNGAGQAVGYGYDMASSLTALTYPDASKVLRGYDPDGLSRPSPTGRTEVIPVSWLLRTFDDGWPD